MLTFLQDSFDHVTAFYTFMYIEKEKHQAVAQEMFRVLKKGGEAHIWDTQIISANPFMVDVDIIAAGEHIHTTYGIYKDHARQDMQYFIDLFEGAGFTLRRENGGANFYLCFTK